MYHLRDVLGLMHSARLSLHNNPVPCAEGPRGTGPNARKSLERSMSTLSLLYTPNSGIANCTGQLCVLRILRSVYEVLILIESCILSILLQGLPLQW
jgi:hypothetical protein